MEESGLEEKMLRAWRTQGPNMTNIQKTQRSNSHAPNVGKIKFPKQRLRLRGSYFLFPKQRLRDGVLTLYVHKLVDPAGFPGAGRLVPGCGWRIRAPVAVAVAGSFWRRAPAVAVAGALWCRCGAYG